MVNWFTTVLFDVEIHLHEHWIKLWIYWPISWFRPTSKSRCCKFVNLTISGGIGPIQSQDKTGKKRDGELVHHGLIWRRDTPSRSLGKIVEILTSQLIFGEIKTLQTRQFDDFGRNWSYTKSRQNSVKKEMVNWFTMVLFDVEIRLQDHWVKLWIYRPVSWLSLKLSRFKFVNLTISGGMGPIRSQDKTANKRRWWTGSPWS